MSNRYISFPSLTANGPVTSINSLTGDITLAAGTNVTIDEAGNVLTINASGGGGSGATIELDNLGTTAVNANINPDGNHTRSLGIDDFAYNEIRVRTIQADSPSVGGPPSQLLLQTSDQSIVNSGPCVMISGNTLGNFDSGDVTLESGDAGVGGGTGNSGKILLYLGDVHGSGTRGKLAIQDGSEGTAGDVWTSIDTSGNGAWVTPSGGGGSPGGSNTQVQFNDSSAFAGAVGMVYNKAVLSLALGDTTLASGQNSFAAGENTVASQVDSVAIGRGVQATGAYSFALGYSITPGSDGIASGPSSWVTGAGCNASGNCARAHGLQTVATGDFTESYGTGTIAAGTNQTAVGQYNVSAADELFSVGNGSSDMARATAFAVKASGQVKIQDELTFVVGGSPTIHTLNSTVGDTDTLLLKSGSTSSVGNSAGQLNLFGGDSTAVTGSGNGGPISLLAGSANNTGNGGTVDIEGGSSTAALGGTVSIVSGSGDTSGNITLTVAPGGTTRGSISLDSSTILLNATAGLVMPEISTPANPSAGFNKLYFKSDHKLYRLDSAGNEVLIG